MVKAGYWEDVEFTKIGNREKHEVCGKIMSIVLDIVLFKKSVKHSYKNIQKKIRIWSTGETFDLETQF